MTASEAVGVVKTGDRVFVGSCAGTPQTLTEALSNRLDLRDTEIVHILTLGVASYTDPQHLERFRHNAFFIGENVRDAVVQGRADYTPICLSEIPELFHSGRETIDVALVSVSPPDRHGYCSFGVSCDIVKSATESARVVVAEVNERMPRVLGNCAIHARDIDIMVPTDRALPERPPKPPDAIDRRVARQVATLIEDGSTLQLGVGTIPNVVLEYLHDRKRIGIHTETFSDGVIPLVEKGVITNSEKNRHRGKIVASFVMGSRALYDFVDDNPIVELQPTEYVNDPFIIAQIDRMVSINSALEVDLTGQVCSDSIGTAFYSGVGSHADFARGAARSRGGKPIVALPSTARSGSISRIVPCLKQGAGVVTCRSDVRYVVTEYGIAYLHGKSIRERTMALIQVAHPKFRPWLLSEAKTRNLVYPDQIELPINAPIYPETLERDVALKGGETVFMRPLRLTDEPLLREMFYKLSPDSVHSRFFRMFSALPHEKLQEFLRVDYHADMALVVTTGRSESAKMLAVAHYSADPRTNFAEASFLVRDDWHGRGIGHALMTALVDAAHSRGIQGLTADVLLENQSMLRVFHHCGYPVESELENGVYHLRIPFTRQNKHRQKTAKHDGSSARPAGRFANRATTRSAGPPA